MHEMARSKVIGFELGFDECMLPLVFCCCLLGFRLVFIPLMHVGVSMHVVESWV